MIFWIIGAALAPFAAALLTAALKALFLAADRAGAAPFSIGFACAALAWLAARFFPPRSGPARLYDAAQRRIYIFGHELSHALAAWLFGAKVFTFHVGRRSGHVDLDKSNSFIALAPYCLPVYTAAALLAWRAVKTFRPGLPPAPFLALVGLTLAFHLTKTLEYVWDLSQPDLRAAGGVIFSLSAIAAANGLVVLGLTGALFPRSVFLMEAVRSSWSAGARFWLAAAALGVRALKALRA
ncbi:MAG: hypothetical protein KGL04_04965 [Elusimicrobia bacterium]|nr:hypothetical protein [Elusimicrobiota bacterium]